MQGIGTTNRLMQSSIPSILDYLSDGLFLIDFTDSAVTIIAVRKADEQRVLVESQSVRVSIAFDQE